MELKEKNMEELLEMRNSLIESMDNEDTNLDEVEAEVRAINEEMESRKAAETKRAEIRELVANEEIGEVIENFTEERKTMDIKEIRSSEAYINAFAEYIKSGDDRECRGIITDNGGSVAGMTNIPTPVIVDEIVRTAWEKNEILNRVKKTYIKGNLKVAFEINSSGAAVHSEGAEAVTEEELQLGIIEMVPFTIKKWISVSDEAVAMGGEPFIRYVYEELTYQIIRGLVGAILSGMEGNALVVEEQGSLSINAVTNLLALLKGNPTDIVAIMSRKTWADMKTLATAANYPVDPFEGLPVIFEDLDDGVIIVGDLKAIHVNYPEGDDIKIKWDDLTLATSDMVRVIGRQYVAVEVTQPKALAVLIPEGN